MYFALFFALCVLCSTVVGQATHTVMVGLQGSFFNPPTLSAGLGDTVVFQFLGAFHSVTQSSFESPCLALDGGFNSGVAGTGLTLQGPAPTWSLVITNDSAPIWFFCQVSVPTSHCESGMVGVINPPSIAMYNEFVASAKQVTSTPTPNATLVLTGIGAFATNSPTVLTTSPASSSSGLSTSSSLSTATVGSTSQTTPISSLVPSSTSTPSAVPTHHSNSAAIIGGATGGGVFVLVLLLVAFLFYRNYRRKNLFSDDSSKFFEYRINPSQKPMTQAASDAAVYNQPTKLVFSRSNTTDSPTRLSSPIDGGSSLANVSRVGSTSSGLILQPQRYREQLASSVQPQHGLRNQPSVSSTLRTPVTNSSANGTQANVNIEALATEVASVLLKKSGSQNQMNAGAGSGSTIPSRAPVEERPQSRRNDLNEEIDAGSDSESLSPPPPNYRTALSTGPNRKHLDSKWGAR